MQAQASALGRDRKEVVWELSSLLYSMALVWYFQYKLELACLDHRTSGASLGSIPTLSD